MVSFVDAICSFFFSLPENLQVYFQGVVRGGQSVSVTIMYKYTNTLVTNIILTYSDIRACFLECKKLDEYFNIHTILYTDICSDIHSLRTFDADICLYSFV